jgi:hypothetical protein
VPPPRRAGSANAFLIRVSFAGSAGLLIKQKSAAQGNIEESHGGSQMPQTGTSLFRNRPGALLPKFVVSAASGLLTRAGRTIYDPDAVSI